MSKWERQLRLYTGLILVAYVVPHFINHSLGIFSFDALETFRKVLNPLWNNPVGQLLLYGALVLHLALALWSVFNRATFRMPVSEAVQLIFGLLIPPLMAIHIIGTRVVHTFFYVEIGYPDVVAVQWSSWRYLIQQPVLLLVVWIHLVAGLYFWLRIKSFYPRIKAVFLVAAVMIPTLSLLGYWRAGLTALTWFEDIDVLDEIMAPWGHISDEMRVNILAFEARAWWIMAMLLALTLTARFLNQRLQRRRGVYHLRHANGKTVLGHYGQTMLETFRNAGIAHASVCGGHGRCTTCRVRINTGAATLDPPTPLEAAALVRINAAPGVRLACQIKPRQDISITPLVDPAITGSKTRRQGGVQGHEREVVAVFVDLRDSTKLGERRLPYDVVFVLNQFFAEMSIALKQSRGHYAQFAGDGLMALYGLQSGFDQGCRDALAGAGIMLQRLQHLNKHLEKELDHPLRIGIGIHGGDAIVGTMGPPSSPNYSSIGDNINIAARLEAQSKNLNCILVASKTVLAAAKIAVDPDRWVRVDVRGRDGDIEVVAFANESEIIDLVQLDSTRPS